MASGRRLAFPAFTIRVDGIESGRYAGEPQIASHDLRAHRQALFRRHVAWQRTEAGRLVAEMEQPESVAFDLVED